MWLFLMVLVFCLMILTIVEKVLRLWDRYMVNKISEDLARQLEEEEEMYGTQSGQDNRTD